MVEPHEQGGGVGHGPAALLGEVGLACPAVRRCGAQLEEAQLGEPADHRGHGRGIDVEGSREVAEAAAGLLVRDEEHTELGRGEARGLQRGAGLLLEGAAGGLQPEVEAAGIGHETSGTTMLQS